MGKLKNHLIGLEDEFWAKASEVIGSCKTLPEFCNKMWKHRNNLPFETDEDVMMLLRDAWHDKWSNYQ